MESRRLRNLKFLAEIRRQNAFFGAASIPAVETTIGPWQAPRPKTKFVPQREAWTKRKIDREAARPVNAIFPDTELAREDDGTGAPRGPGSEDLRADDHLEQRPE